MRAFRLAYDGRGFYGFQRQPDVPTVEDALFDALRALDVCEAIPEGYAAAGRTDAGVSAFAQTVAFSCPEWCSPSTLNAKLPRTVRSWASADVSEGFHATHDARRREYAYHLYAPDADDDLAREATRRLAGEHDFHNLTPDEDGTRRDLSIEVERDGDYLVFVVAGGGFPRHLVRRLVTLVHAIATGERQPAAVDRILSAEAIDGDDGVPPAPAYPLVLADVDYDVTFEVDEDAAADARGQFVARQVEDATRSRVAGAIADRL